MDSTVYDQTLKSNPCHLSANRIEPGKHDRFRSVVNDKFDTGEGLKCPDIPSLPADDPSFHLIAGELHDRDRGLGHVIGRTALDRIDNKLFRLFVCVFLGLRLQFPDHLCRVMLNIFFNSFQQIFFCLFGGKS